MNGNHEKPGIKPTRSIGGLLGFMDRKMKTTQKGNEVHGHREHKEDLGYEWRA